MTAEKRGDLIIRAARPEDAQALVGIFAPYVRESVVSFDYQAPDVPAFREKISRILRDYPFFVALIGEKPVGYCYASRFRAQKAYDWAVETTIYVDSAYHGKGIGRVLYRALEEALTRQNVITLYACISAGHAQSLAFHRRLGYREAARFDGVGYKMGEWLDIVWMEKRLSPLRENPEPLIPYRMIAAEQ